MTISLDDNAIEALPSKALDVALDYLLWAKPVDERFAMPKAEKSDFLAHVRHFRTDWTFEDLSVCVDHLWGLCQGSGPAGWLEAVVRLARLDIDFRGAEPVVPTPCAGRWLKVADRLDQDILVAHLLVRKGLAHQVSDLNSWDAIVRIGDGDIDRILDQGISDLHIHLQGVRSAQLTWAKILLGEVRMERLPRYDTVRRGAGPKSAEAGEILLERNIIAHVLRALKSHRAVQAGHDPGGDSLSIGAYLGGPRGVAALACGRARYQKPMRAERAMLVDLMRRRHDALPVLANEALATRENAALSAYILAKSLFLRAHQQPTDRHAGLGAFIGYMKTTRQRVPRLARNVRLGRSAAADAAINYSEFASFLMQSTPRLRMIELRQKPLESLRAYASFFRAWQRVEEAFGISEAESPLKVRFAIHFKRDAITPAERRSESVRHLPDTVIWQRQLDQEAAVLHRFRIHSHSKVKAWASRIERIDLAGPERDNGPLGVAFQMRLLRGDADAMARLDREVESSDMAHHHWHELMSRSRIPPVAVNAPRLRLTCHAGEDFAHPLEGLFSIDMACRYLPLGVGDSIGHGLALTTDIAVFESRRLGSTLTSRGVLFDSLLWLRAQIMTWPTTSFYDVLPQLDDWLQASLRQIYGPDVGLLTPAQTNSLWKRRAGPVPPKPPPSREWKAIDERMRHLEVWDDKCHAARSTPVSLGAFSHLSRLGPAIRHAQENLRDFIAESGIVIEINPSSNLRISGAPDWQQVAFVQLLQHLKDDVLASVNTDDPGTFGTRIENEYAYVFQALREASLSRAQCLRILDRLRAVGMRQ